MPVRMLLSWSCGGQEYPGGVPEGCYGHLRYEIRVFESGLKFAHFCIFSLPHPIFTAFSLECPHKTCYE